MSKLDDEFPLSVFNMTIGGSPAPADFLQPVAERFREETLRQVVTWLNHLSRKRYLGTTSHAIVLRRAAKQLEDLLDEAAGL